MGATHKVPRPAPVSLPGSLSELDYARLRRAVLAGVRANRVVLDAACLRDLDAVGAARLLRLAADLRTAGVDVRLEHAADPVRRALSEIDADVLDAAQPPSRRHPLEVVGAKTLDGLEATRAAAALTRETAAGLAKPIGRHGIKWDRTLEQMARMGSAAVPIVVFISVLVGVVLALNGAQQLRQFGAAIFVANLVGISMTREMGPLVTAIIVAGRSGSAVAAEIGAMVISEEVDAMRVMALGPIRFLVVPKVLALVCVLPLLTVLSNAAGIAGGYAIGVLALDLGHDAYLAQTVQSLLISDVLTGLVKSMVFAVLIGLIGAYHGFRVRGGPEAVGRATTAAVVSAIVACIAANAVFTLLFYLGQ